MDEKGVEAHRRCRCCVVLVEAEKEVQWSELKQVKLRRQAQTPQQLRKERCATTSSHATTIPSHTSSSSPPHNINQPRLIRPRQTSGPIKADLQLRIPKSLPVGTNPRAQLIDVKAPFRQFPDLCRMSAPVQQNTDLRQVQCRAKLTNPLYNHPSAPGTGINGVSKIIHRVSYRTSSTSSNHFEGRCTNQETALASSRHRKMVLA